MGDQLELRILRLETGYWGWIAGLRRLKSAVIICDAN